MLAPGEPANENEALVVRFFDAMGTDYAQMRTAFEEFLSADCLWANQGLPEVRGRDEVLGYLGQLHEQTGLADVGGEVLAIASRGGTVLTERHERWTDANGTVLVESLPVMGTFEVTDGRISSWRDYYDSARLAPLLSEG